MQYLDVDVDVDPGTGRDYPVSARSPAGQAHATMHFPFDTLELENQLLRLQNVLLNSGGGRRKALTPNEEAVQQFGQQLFEALLTPDLRSLYYESKREATRQSKGIRLRLHIRPPELAALPWEYLYDPRVPDYLCLSRQTPLVRYLDLAHPIEPLAVSPPLRVLVMLASPNDQDPLNIAREKERINQALAPLEARGLLKLHWLEGQTWRELHRALQGGPWHVFHFIGHGGFDSKSGEGVLALAGEQGKTELLHATQLARLLANHGFVRLAVLNACEGARGNQHDIFSSTAAMLAQRGIPGVLAMQEAITDLAAIELTRAFYEALATGMPVDTAVAEARVAINLGINNSLEWGTPVLYLRSPDGLLFHLAEHPQQTVSPSQPLQSSEENVGALRTPSPTEKQQEVQLSHQLSDMQSLVEVAVESVRTKKDTGQRVLILKAKKQESYLLIWTSKEEALSIAMELQGATMPRPNTHDLFKSTLTELGAKITRVIISDLEEDIFYARLVASLGDREPEIDARPADVIALALRAGAPIFVKRQVMEKAGVTVIPDV